MSLETERILLQSKIDCLKNDLELKKIEGEMFVSQVRNELSPYLEFADVDTEKAMLAMTHIVRIKTEIKLIVKEINALERKLN